ncbi:MAG: GNAT family N-acetyltransferase [Victivallaceae bacterium]|nr:GNAT family N-acetyltransferase [Victivallaceae bacterium]
MARDFDGEITAGALPAPEEAVALYRAAKWWGEENDFGAMRKMLENSFAVVCARSGGKLVGMMRAISDGISDAYMLDLVVAPEYRRRGIGKRLTDFLAAHLETCGIEWIVCIGVPGTENVYGKCERASAMAGHTPWRFRAGSSSGC